MKTELRLHLCFLIIDQEVEQLGWESSLFEKERYIEF